MSVRIDVQGDDDALEDLWEWLGAERDLRGRMRWESPPASEGTMGSGVEIAVRLTELGFTGIGTLASAIGTWLTYRSTQPAPPVRRITLTAPDGTRVEIENPDSETVGTVLSRSPHFRSDDDPAA
ncbi:hypothetical protein O3S80_23245 [Streptomyces sp. Lzd4kr]|nr:hypothetical protein [Streptomyces sp. Lzd4kr]